MNNRKMRATLTVVLSVLGIVSLMMNMVYVYRFGPPYQSSVEERPPFGQLSALALRGKPIHVARRSLDIAPSEEENSVTTEVITTTTPNSATTTVTTPSSATTTVTTPSSATTTVTTSTPSSATTTVSTTSRGSISTKSTKKSLASTSKTTSTTDKYVATSSSDQNSFVIVGSYFDPTSLLAKSLFQLGQFANHISVDNIVAPWVFGYRSYGAKRLVANTDKGTSSLALNRLYDLKTLNNQVSQCTGASVVPFTDFVEKATRNVAVVYFVRDTFTEPRQFHLQPETEKHLFNTEFNKSGVVDCLKGNHSKNMVKLLLDGLNAELTISNSKKFQITSFICVDNRKVIKMSEVSNFIKKQKHSKTVLLLNWRGMANLTKESYDKSKYWIEGNWKYPNDKCYDPVIPFHFEVPKSAHQFLTHAGVTEANYLGVYIAIESLAKLINNPFTECCMKETKRVVRAILNKYHLKGAIVIAEYNNQSTKGCDYNCVTKALAMVDMLTSLGLNVSRFDPAAIGSKHNHLTFNSFAEVSMVSTGKRLLLVGQSLWYQQLKARFLQHYPPDGINKMYALCTNSGTYLRDLPSKTANCDKLM